MKRSGTALVGVRGVAAGAIAMGAIVVGAGIPAVSEASLSASSSVCRSFSSYGVFVGSSCAYGDDAGQSGPGSIPGGSGVGSGTIAGSSSAGALQDYGVFHGYAKAAGAGVAGVGDAGGVTSGSQGSMRDLWTLTGGTGFGYLTLGWTITGQTALDGHPGAYAILYMDVQTASGSQTKDDAQVIRDGGYYTVSRIPFFFDRPFDLTVTSSVYAADGYEAGGGAYAFYAAADFGHTSILSSIDAYDVSGRHIDGLTITAASGARYPVGVDVTPVDPTPPGPPAQIPEPGVGSLLVAGLVAVGYTRRGTLANAVRVAAHRRSPFRIIRKRWKLASDVAGSMRAAPTDR